MDNSIRKTIFDTISDCVANFLYYDRKEDSDLPVGEMERLNKLGSLSVDEVMKAFETGLRKQLK